MAENSDLTSNIFNFFYDPNLIINIPDKSDYLTASVATYRSIIYSAAKLLVENAKLGSTFIKITGFAADAPFAIINVVLSIEDEGLLKASATGLTADGTSIAIGGLVGTAIGGVPGAVGGAVISGALSLIFNPMADTAYDFYSKKIKDIKYDNDSGNLNINTTIEDMDSLKKITEPYILYGSVEENHYINNVIINQEVGDQTNTYHVKTGDTMGDIANRFGVTQEELIEANPWLSDRYSEDKSFALIRPDEQIIIPEGSIKGTDNSSMTKYLNDALKGDIHADTIAPSGVTLPSSGKTGNTTVEHYTSKPQMMSQNDIFLRALKEGNIEALKKVIPNADKNLLNVLRFFATIPGNPLQNTNINQTLNNMLFAYTSVNAKIVSQLFKNIPPTFSSVCPMAIDLDGEGIETIDINDSKIYFDVDNDGFREQTGWISKNEAILAIDKNGNGKIDDQSEMFGSTEKTGFEELKELDSNSDGIIDVKDKDFSKIRVWQDLNENGVTDEGELKTAEEAGIKAIYTNSYKMNGANNNNLITEKATIQYTDGTTKDLYDVATQYNDMYTVYGGDYILDADVIDLPWLRGYGNSIDLQLAASQNDNLKAIIKEMAAMTSATSIYNKFDDMMSLWLGENKTGEEMQKLVLSKLIKLDLENMSNFQANNISNTYNSLKSKLFVEFIAQTGLADKFDIAYDYKTDTIIYSDNTYENIVRNTTDSDAFTASYIIAKMLADDGSLDVTRLANTIKKLGYGSQLINYINSGLKFKNGDFTYVEGSMPLYVIGSDGNDTITGGDGADIIYGMDGNDLIYGGAGDDFLNGGRGNDTLYGGDGNDTLIGGEGDDTLIGGGGDDTYIYDGDGKDAVFDEKWITVRTQKWVQANYWTDYYPVWEESKTLVDAGNDIVIFGKNVTIEDITISQNGNNLVFGLKGTNNTLTIKIGMYQKNNE